jgi:hypothetical protein
LISALKLSKIGRQKHKHQQQQQPKQTIVSKKQSSNLYSQPPSQS